MSTRVPCFKALETDELHYIQPSEQTIYADVLLNYLLQMTK